MDNLTYSLLDLNLPDELNNLSKVIRYSQSILEELTQMNSIHYEELTIITLYRKLIETADGVFVLADYRLESPSISVARAAYEVFLQLDFMFKDEKDINRKALSYYSTWLFEEVLFINKQLLVKDPLLPRETLILKRQMNNKLLDAEFISFKKEIVRTMRKLGIKYPPKWYSLYNGPSSLSELSKKTSLKGVHSILYKGMSAEAHGLKAITNLSNPNHNLLLAPIRSTEIPLMPVHLVRSFLTNTTNKIINKYLQNQIAEFKEFVFTLFGESLDENS
ncbi:DUF5677 domain-containing protein [Pseudobacillus sp. FSL P4-0506]|uniref:DUF5677 domain-containing protein n=1 Tax=Pseudobacillus sp. FSL P4-0506 TaxID=2921576 RepID=UPI0030FB83C7